MLAVSKEGSATTVGDVYIHPSAKVDPSAKVRGSGRGDGDRRRGKEGEEEEKVREGGIGVGEGKETRRKDGVGLGQELGVSEKDEERRKGGREGGAGWRRSRDSSLWTLQCEHVLAVFCMFLTEQRLADI